MSFSMRMGMGLGAATSFNIEARETPTFSFANGADGNKTRLRLTFNEAVDVYSDGGITIATSSDGTYGTQINLAAGAQQIYVTTNGTSGNIYIKNQTITRFGTTIPAGAIGTGGTGWSHSTANTYNANQPTLTIYVEKFHATDFDTFCCAAYPTIKADIVGEFSAVQTLAILSSVSYTSDWDVNMPNNLQRISFHPSALLSVTLNGPLPSAMTYIDVSHNGFSWTYDGALPDGLIAIGLNGSSINWTGVSTGDFGTAVSTFDLSNALIGTRSIADTIALIKQISDRTVSGGTITAANITIGETPDLKDTNQGGIWGDYTGTPAPSDLAIAVKNLVITKGLTLTLNTWGCTLPGGSGDGTGFPAGFGGWWRS